MNMIEQKEVKLGEIATFRYGKMPDTSQIIQDESKGFPVFSGYRIVGYYPKYIYEKPKLILVCRGVGGTGDVKISPPNCWLTNLSIAFNFKDKDTEIKYFYYLFKVYKLRFLDSGSAQSQITIADLEKLKISLPPIETQKKIAAVLSAYDDLIENNKRRIALLEKMAEEIYREWFVRMRFPGYKETKFEKGVPVGWEIKPVDFLGKIVTGKTPSTIVSRYYGDSYLFIKTPDMHDQMFLLDTGEKLSEDGLKSQPSQTLPPNSISVSCIGTGGIVSITTTKCQTNQQINSIILDDVSNLEWAFFTIKNLKETIQLFGSTGTTMTNLSKGKFSALKILVPDENLRKAFNNSIKTIFSKMQLLMKNNQNLTTSRDLLLSRLISGKLSVENLDIQFPPSMREEEMKAEVRQE